MKRVDIQKGVNEVAGALFRSEIAVALRNFSSASSDRKAPNRDAINAALLRSLRDYAVLASSFSPAAQVITHAFGIDILEQPDFWAVTLSGERNARIPSPIATFRLVEFAVNELPRIFALLDRDLPTDSDKVNKDKHKSGILTVIIVESEDHLSSPQRLIDVLAGVQELYSAYSTLFNSDAKELGVLALDSGSDKVIDFSGASDLIDRIKETLAAAFKRFAFYKEQQHAERLKGVSQSLPIIAEISTMEKEGHLTHEEAEKMKWNIYHSTDLLFSAGIVTSEMESQAYNEPRLIMAPEQKLLAAPKVDTATVTDGTVVKEKPPKAKRKKPLKKRASNSAIKADDGTPDFSKLSPEERQALIALLTTAQNDESTKPEAESPDSDPEDDIEE